MFGYGDCEFYEKERERGWGAVKGVKIGRIAVQVEEQL